MKKYIVQKSEELEKAKQYALGLMQKSGFSLTENIEIGLNPTLQFMGYTTETRSGTPLIVVSKMAVDSGGVAGLLIHEMGHIYRTETKHPSHNFPLLNKTINWVLREQKLQSFQDESLHTIVNCIEDIYADDISFAVFKKFPIETFRLENINEFFLSWIHTPLEESSKKAKWKNAEFVVNAAFAKANLIRNKVVDSGEKIEKAIEDFLTHIAARRVKEYEYFETFMIQLPEKVTEADFKKQLIEYLQHFLQLTTY